MLTENEPAVLPYPDTLGTRPPAGNAAAVAGAADARGAYAEIAVKVEHNNDTTTPIETAPFDTAPALLR